MVSGNMKPLSLKWAVFFFGVPMGFIYFTVYWLMPRLDAWGIPGIVNANLCITGPLVLMFIAALVAFKMEGHTWSWVTFKKRYRLEKMTGKLWLWTLGLLVFTFLAEQVMSFSTEILLKIPFLQPPDFLPEMLDPRIDPSTITDFMGVPLEGAWWILLMYLGILFFNILGEEFWWRGYILPRQELVHGKYTWIIHGVLWTLFHYFWKWDLLVLLPTCLAVAFVAQKTKSTWPGIVVHFILNGLAIVPITMAILGN
ncbi:MAG: CPBP family intramembrane metalloprotease [Candidatus Aminicenantes bacterium]|nr:CPBP family intramembrane metalloprotease [Candidatus Aminicenantes bacterium]